MKDDPVEALAGCGCMLTAMLVNFILWAAAIWVVVKIVKVAWE